VGKAKIIAKRVLICLLLSFYVATTAGVIVLLVIGRYKFAEIKHIGTSSLIGLVVSFLPIFIKRVFKIEMSLSVILFGGIMIFLNTLGEIFDLYYLLPNWDVTLHTFGGYGFAFLVFGAFYSVKQPRGRMQTAIYLLGAIAISVSISTLWELLEYTTDNVLGTNMLKTIPENELFNGGSTRETLVGTDGQIADFYRHPAGYMYAVKDTMEDLICGFIGALVLCAEYLIIGRRHSAHYKRTFVKIRSADRLLEV
jgi:hypothetical protein